MFEEVIIAQNKHWSGDLYEAGVPRSYFQQLLDYVQTGLIVSVTGVRRSGKSTLLKQLINYLMQEKKVSPKNILFLNLEHPYFLSYSKSVENLEKIYEDYLKVANPDGKVYCFLDEVQFFAQWQVFVKAHYEQKNIQFVVTGSNSALLSSELMTLLSGRSLPIEVFPLSFYELAKARNLCVDNQIEMIRDKHKLRHLVEFFLKYGGFPEVCFQDNQNVLYDILTAYAKTILYQDVAPRLHIRKTLELERLFVYLMSNVGNLFSYASVAKLFDLSDKAVKEYITVFVDSYLLFELDLFDFSLKKQLRNPKKIYAIDPGVVNAVAFQFSSNVGRLLENAVFLELRRLGLEMYYYKTHNNLEIDFIAKKQLKMTIIQVAWQVQDQKTLEREQRALLSAMDELKLTRGLIITENDEARVVAEDKEIIMMPAYKFFSWPTGKKIEFLFE